MRQQYHHRTINGDVHIWNVNKLVRQVQGATPVEIALSEIEELDETFWFSDVGGNVPTCRAVADHAKLIMETDLIYPVLLCPDKRVIDGMHRICKAYISGYKTVQAIILSEMPEPDYMNKNLEELPYD